APYVRAVSIAGSLATGGFRESDDVDLNLIVDDGHRHLAYVAVNALGLVHALAHRAKPVDDLTRRPLAPRLMTANLILERSQCLPLARQDEDMAFELLVARPVFGSDEISSVIESNPGLLDHAPQLAFPGRCFRASSTIRRELSARPRGGTCSGRDATGPRLSRALRSCGRPCGLTRCSTAVDTGPHRDRPGGDEPAALCFRAEPSAPDVAVNPTCRAPARAPGDAWRAGGLRSATHL